MRRVLAWIAGAFGIAALLRLRRRQEAQEAPAADPAAELRRRLEEARGATSDRDAYDAAEGMPIDEADAPKPSIDPQPSLDERRRAIHARAQEALGEMNPPSDA